MEAAANAGTQSTDTGLPAYPGPARYPENAVYTIVSPPAAAVDAKIFAWI